MVYNPFSPFINRLAWFLNRITSTHLSKAGQLDYKPSDQFINRWPVYKPVRFIIGSQHISSSKEVKIAEVYLCLLHLYLWKRCSRVVEVLSTVWCCFILRRVPCGIFSHSGCSLNLFIHLPNGVAVETSTWRAWQSYTSGIFSRMVLESTGDGICLCLTS